MHLERVRDVPYVEVRADASDVLGYMNSQALHLHGLLSQVGHLANSRLALVRRERSFFSISLELLNQPRLVGYELVEGRLHRRDEDVGVDVVQPSRGVGSREEAHTTQVGGLLVQLAIERQELERRVRAAALLEREAAEVLEEEVDFL